MAQMTTVGTPQVSDYSGRIVEIEVTGVCRQDVKRVSAYKVKVPHSRMNQAMQEIYRLGGRVTAVKTLG
ncbi:MAG: rod-capping linker protein [Symploca sp. SIO2C1]|nr:rod-capping linker protein [Symploca sp. SIO2C1]